MGTFGQEPREAYVKVPFRLEVTETRLDRTFAPQPFVPGNLEERNRRCEEILSIQSYGLKKRFEHTGLHRAVIGVSGGLDSTLALLVTVRTFDLLGLDRKGISAVTMPCFGTTDRTWENACRLANTLGVTLEEVDIREAVQVHFRDIGQDSAAAWSSGQEICRSLHWDGPPITETICPCTASMPAYRRHWCAIWSDITRIPAAMRSWKQFSPMCWIPR